MNKMKIMLGMSGGVDSSVAALLLKRDGFDVLGVTLILTENDDGTNAADAKEVASLCGIPHITVDLRREFKKYVTDYFVTEYKCGRTPNPCIACNKFIKFGKMLDVANENGCEYVATGHYANVVKNEKTGLYSLKKAAFTEKDQSYFLYTLTQHHLSKVLMPLGKYDKSQVRELADSFGISVAKKRDSQDICFIPDGDKNKFLKNFLPEQEGNFVDINGNFLGKHKGIFNYTVGQRKGLGMAFGKPMFVLRVDAQNNTVVLGEAGDENSSSFYVEDLNFIPFENAPDILKCMCKARYSAPEVPCIIEKQDKRFKVSLDSPVRAITPGQAAVFYIGDEVIGGGTIVSD